MAESNQSISKKVFSGAVWKFGERIIAQAVSMLVTLILARLLNPTDYGVVGIVTVFFAFSNVIISGGLNTALIQKVDADADDYNTVFTFSFFVSIIIYTILFFLAPWLSEIYHQPVLRQVIRVAGLSLPIYAVKSIVCAYVSSNLDFKMFFYSTLGGTLFSAVVGITMAVNGCGVWALVAQQLSNTLLDTLILFYVTKLRLSFKIVFNRLKTLIGYGSKIFASSMMGNIIAQLNPLFIGIKYTSADLSYYTKGSSFPESITSSLVYTLASVLFPALARYQDDKEKLLQYTRSYIRLASFIVFPVMLGFLAVAHNFVRVFLTDKWLPAVYYIQIACISYMFDVIAAGNCETIKAMGRSDIFLKMEIKKKACYFLIMILLLSVTDSPKELALSMPLCTLVSIIVNCIPNQKLIGYKIRYQILDLLPNLFSSVIMCVVVLLTAKLQMNSLLLLILQITVGIVVYLGLCILTHNDNLTYLIKIIKNRTE